MLVPIVLCSGCGFAARGLDYLTRTYACGTHTDPAALSVYQSANPLQIGIPAAVRFVVGVAYIVSETRTLATDLTFSCHMTSNPRYSRKYVEPLKLVGSHSIFKLGRGTT